MEITKNNLFEYGGIPITLQRLAILNPTLLKTYFTANSSYVLSDDALEVVKKIRNKSVKAKILSLDTYRKELAKERNVNELYDSSDNLKMGNCGVLVYHHRTRYLLYGI